MKVKINKLIANFKVVNASPIRYNKAGKLKKRQFKEEPIVGCIFTIDAEAPEDNYFKIKGHYKSTEFGDVTCISITDNRFVRLVSTYVYPEIKNLDMNPDMEFLYLAPPDEQSGISLITSGTGSLDLNLLQGMQFKGPQVI